MDNENPPDCSGGFRLCRAVIDQKPTTPWIMKPLNWPPFRMSVSGKRVVATADAELLVLGEPIQRRIHVLVQFR